VALGEEEELEHLEREIASQAQANYDRLLVRGHVDAGDFGYKCGGTSLVLRWCGAL
jgi:hypothetical protein